MPASPAPSPLDILWQAPAIMSAVIVGEGLALVLALAPGGTGDRWVFFGLASLLAQWVLLLALGGLYVLRMPLAKLTWQTTAQIAVLLLMLSTWLVSTAAWFALRDYWPLAAAAWMGLLWRLTAIALILGMLGLAAMQNYWHARLLALRAKQAELDALQARIHPHFLFNTLNTGAALVRAQPDKAEQLLLDLSDLFRASLSAPRQVPLSEELALTHRYLQIESLRLGPRLRLRWQVAEDLPQVEVPILSLQPLAENAVRHGVEPSTTGGNVEISVQLDAGAQFVQVTIANDVPAAAAHTAGHNVGLASARERILAIPGSSMQVDLKDGRHIVSILLPLRAAC
jgi:two-component system sensor histidine kinase AlgZ